MEPYIVVLKCMQKMDRRALEAIEGESFTREELNELLGNMGTYYHAYEFTSMWNNDDLNEQVCDSFIALVYIK